ncbi:MAG: TIGR03435 family protein [Acidobacteriia bacterium]|nr:TIGR03435 family protein [Terriglobia bacterium]
MRIILLTLLGAGIVLAQTPADLKFEVASIHPSQPTPDRVDLGYHIDGAQVRIVSVPMRDYIARAYRLKPYQVTGPDWITSERFDLNAKIPEGSSPDHIAEMLQSLLAERFQIKVHHDQKELPVYALIVGKPPLKIQESKADPPAPDAPAPAKGAVNVAAQGSAAGVSVNLGNGSYYTFANNKLEVHKFSMDMLARQLERYTDRPIVDITGLTGVYDLSVTVTQEDAQVMMIRAAVNAGMTLAPQVIQYMDNGSIASLLDGFQQLGLKLDTRKMPMDLLVVDRLSKTPSEN